MARRKPAWLQKREADIAKAREEYYANRTPSTTTTVRERPSIKRIYASYSLKDGATSQLFYVPVSKKSHLFFGGGSTNSNAAASDTALGLKTTRAEADPLVAEKPSNFHPAQVKAMIGAANPTASTSPWGSRVIKYSAATSGDSQAHFSAPISAGVANCTLEATAAKAEAALAALSDNLGNLDYAKFYFIPEKFTNSLT